MTSLRGTFGALAYRNFRLYFAGQAISITGEWAQRIGQAWLVLELSGSATLLGVTAGLQQLPTLLVGPWGGLLADRIDNRRMMFWTQSCAGLLALAIGVLISVGAIEVWMVLVFAFLLGCTKSLDKPAKQNLVLEMVGRHRLVNAVALNSILFNVARSVGPAIAGLLIATVGLAASFYVNAGSYVAVLGALAAIRVAEMERAPRVVRSRGQLREGFRYAWSTPGLRGPLLLMAVSGLLAYEWAVTLPLLARDAFGGDAATFGAMFSAMGVGAVIGGLAVAGRIQPTRGWLLNTAVAFSLLMVVTALAPTFEFTLVALLLLGAVSIAFRSTATALVQLRARPDMRGRVMSLLAVALLGTAPIGGPLVGWLSEVIGIRAVFLLGGLSTAVAAILASNYVKRHGSDDRSESFT